MPSATAELLAPFRARFAAFGALSFAMGLVEATFLVVVTQSIISIADAGTPLDLPLVGIVTVGEAAAMAAALVALRLALGFVSVGVQTGLTYRINTSLRTGLARDYLSARWVARARLPRGTFQHLVVQLPANTTSLVFQLSNAVAGSLSLLSLLVVAFFVDPVASLIVLGALSVLGSVLFPLRRAVRARTRQALAHQTAFTHKVSEVEDLGLEIDALGVSAAMTSELERLVENEMRAHRRVGSVAQAIPTVYTTLAYGAIVLAVLALDAWAGDDLGGTSAVLLIMLRSLTYGQQIQQGATATSQLGPVATRLAEYRHDLRSSGRANGTRELDGVHTLSFSEVSFSYDSPSKVLHDVTFDLTHGEAVGLVGASGAGKTTLVHLLLGLLEPTSGVVHVDGTRLSDIDPVSWHRLIAHVPQETRLLDGTLADNVRFLRDDITDQAVERALEMANLSLDGGRFADGILTDLGAAGRAFSGGQRQRLAIARALVTEPAILVLDEPTASLDTESEEVVVETIERLKGRVTIVVVAHRDSTLRACDRVLRVDDGTVSVEPPR